VAASTTPDPAEERNLQRLAAVYEQMPAEEAAPILKAMQKPLVEKLLRRMDDRQVAKVLLALNDVKQAAAFSTALAKPVTP
jgi:flagellar motility protein MotE (MotC chaperone)